MMESVEYQGTVSCWKRSTRDMLSTGTLAQPFNLHGGGTGAKFIMPCAGAVSGSAQVDVIEGTGTAFVLTVIVSNDPEGKIFVNHPTSATLTNAARITGAISLVGYLYFGVQLTTVAGSATTGHVFLVCKDSPA